MEGVPLHGRSRYWVDETGRKSVDEVEAGVQLPWAPRDASQQHNIDGKGMWIQFDAIATVDGRWFVEIALSGLDRAQLFYRDARGAWVVQEAGDSKPVSQWPLPGRVPTFELAHEVGRTVRYWLRVEHARVNFAAPIALYDQGRLIATREREQFLLGAYFGLAALITIVAFANAVAFRDRSFGAYAIYVALLAIGQAAYLGVGAQHLWDHMLRWNETATFLLPGISTAAGLWFVHTVTEPVRFSRLLDMVVWGVIAALMIAVGIDTMVTSRVTFGIVMLLTTFALALVFVLILLVWKRGDDPTIRLIALGFLPVLVMAIFPVARGLNLIPNSALTRYGLTMGAVLEMPILFYALSLRGARRRESLVRAMALQHTDALTGLAHSRSLLTRLEAALVRARSQRHPCALLGVKISNFEAIVSEYGREAAEKALVVAASILRRAITDVDLAARVGDNEFMLLLEGPTTTAAAMSRAQQVIATGLRPAEALPPGLTLKFHVSVALLPDRDLDPAGSLKWVLEGVNSIPYDARKLIRPLNF
nr:7TM diverse intracellular signaling domain-containing protein [Ramlibacter albus]